MENNSRSMRRTAEFDWMLSSQNPNTESLAPAYSNNQTIFQDHRYNHQLSPLTNQTGSSSSMLPATAYPFMNKQHLPDIRTFSGVNSGQPMHALLPEFNPYEAYSNYRCNSCHPEEMYGYGYDHHRPSLSDFQQTLMNDHRNLEILFNRLNMSSSPVGHVRSRDMGREYANNNVQWKAHGKRTTKVPTSLKEIRGKILMVAKDQEGCQFLQTKCEEGKVENIEMIFDEIKDHICEVMTDGSMNYLAQKMFKVCSERQMTHFVVSLIRDDDTLTSICLNSHGTRAMQKLIEVLTSAEQRYLMVSALRRITVTLTKNMNGHHVIQHCLKSFHLDEVQPILNVVADNCLDIATDKSGCCVLQQCVLHADGLSKDRLMTEIIDNALHLAEHPYGNYVVQHILGMQIPEATAGIMQNLAGNIVYLAMNKYGSNVVEKCLKDAPDDQSMPIIREIINSPNLLSLIQHPFGNYVAQSALQTAKGSIKEMMINRIQKEYPLLHSHPHGKRVLALARNSKLRGSFAA